MAISPLAASLSFQAQRLAHRVPGVIAVRYVIVATPVAALPRALRGGLEVAEIVPDEAIAAGLVTAEAAAWRASQGMAAIGVSRRDALVGVTWVGEGPFDEDEAPLRFEPPPGAAWDTGLMIAERARGGRVFAALWAGVRAWCEARGLDWSLSRIADYNLGSRRAHLRLGATELGNIGVIGAGKHFWTWGKVRGRTADGRFAVRLEVPR